MAGYSGTPLARKLGIKEGGEVVVLGAPPGVVEEDLPADIAVARELSGSSDVVVAFFTERVKLGGDLDDLARAVFPAGGLWIAWPKRASGQPTDITEDVVREVALPHGLVDNKVCAIDAVWSGLRLVWRRELRRQHGR